MNGKDDDDPFASVHKLCHTSSSQEVLLGTRLFSHKAETSPDGVESTENSEIQVASTGICMVSLSETLEDDSIPRDESQTLPEDSSLLSSDKHTFGTVVWRVGDGTIAVDGSYRDGEMAVDLGNSDLGFSKVKPIERNCGVLEMGIHSVVVSSESESKRLKLCEANLKIDRAGHRNYDSKSSEDCHGNEEMMVENCYKVCSDGEKFENCNLVENNSEWRCAGDTEVVLDSEESDEISEFGEEDLGAKGGVKGSSARKKNIEDVVEKFRYVGPSDPNSRKMMNTCIQRKRQLPSSIIGPPETSAGEAGLVSGTSSTENDKFLMGLHNVLKMLEEKCDPVPEDGDMFDIAKRRGMTFPRPSWWPPEGVQFEEEEKWNEGGIVFGGFGVVHSENSLMNICGDAAQGYVGSDSVFDSSASIRRN